MAADPPAAARLREWMAMARDHDGFEFCCDTAEENGLTYDVLVALLDLADAAYHFVEEVNTFDNPTAAVESKLPMRDALVRIGMVRVEF